MQARIIIALDYEIVLPKKSLLIRVSISSAFRKIPKTGKEDSKKGKEPEISVYQWGASANRGPEQLATVHDKIRRRPRRLIEST